MLNFANSNTSAIRLAFGLLNTRLTLLERPLLKSKPTTAHNQINMKNIYILMPVNYSLPFKQQMQHDKAQYHVGRGKPLQDAVEKLERDLNGGKTIKEIMQQANTPEGLQAYREAIHVVSDTYKAWADYNTFNSWPIVKQIEREQG